MFDSLEMAPPDPILGLGEAFKMDTNPSKVNLTVGVYKDANGDTPILESVKKAEERLLSQESTKAYLDIEGRAEQAAVVQELLFGSGHEIIKSKRAATAHTPGGTGALRVAADFMKGVHPGSAVWVSEPTWPNHPAVFNAAGLNIKKYPYYDAEKRSLDFDAMCEALEQVPPGDIVLLHGCCHNPTGIDPTKEQWRALADLAGERHFLPLLDFAYQGFANGLDEDAAGVRMFCELDIDLVIASSYSKNFGLYNERVGALTVVTKSDETANAVIGHMKRTIRVNYSNPPAHGGLIVTAVLSDPALCKEWEGEVAQMRDRINDMRALFVDTLKKKGVKRDFSFLKDQRGMFSFSGLTKDQVEELREKHSVYIVGSGRINVAGMTTDNVDALCTAIAAVLG
ncbi:MAG: amino acid aminotransferase [Candidatus Hydrogenedentes bacterium]|jgi:aspartate aminotransferase/aromatic-amino-acid transaminase|nr:amino acid aminotransferase [Candidatus Hydrogenedentota bacterium]